MKDICKNCKWWQFKEELDDAAQSEHKEKMSWGICHRWPPNQREDRDDVLEFYIHNQTSSLGDDWCGEFAEALKGE